jgi:EAL domain-containing protein (putative c-di-GMP-specific phosphodiesterase class I)
VQALPGATSRAVVGAIVEITHSYGGTVLAECVETEEQADSAQNLGVDLSQGWLFGRPERRTPAVPASTRDDAVMAGVSPDRPDSAVAIALTL